ncbi:MAG: hypothetical protein D4R98_05655 [Comamonadaceae bacterium]|nr:MAG: hypothetical protein D4R98_05655 [Comamonadaceae bacterium]
MNLDDLSDFCLVASNGGFAKASRSSGRPKASLSRKVMDLLVVSAPSLVRQSPVPVVVRHAGRNPAIWQIAGSPSSEIETMPVLELPALTMIRDAVLTGIVAAKLPLPLVKEDLAAGRLISWGALAGQPTEIWALHPSRRLASAKVKAFMQFLKTAFHHD